VLTPLDRDDAARRLSSATEFQLSGDWPHRLAGFTTFAGDGVHHLRESRILHEAGPCTGRSHGGYLHPAAIGGLLSWRLQAPSRSLGDGAERVFHYVVVRKGRRGAVFLPAWRFCCSLGVRRLIISVRALRSGGGWRRPLFASSISATGIIVPDPATTVTLGHLRNPPRWMLRSAADRRAAGLTVHGRRARSASSLPCRPAHRREMDATGLPPAILATAFQLVSSHCLGFLEIVFVFLFIDLFDNIGTLVAVGKEPTRPHAQIPRVDRILSDATAP
jgi:AGZA family xanthine/uracil permease-like MFS transporter